MLRHFEGVLTRARSRSFRGSVVKTDCRVFNLRWRGNQPTSLMDTCIGSNSPTFELNTIEYFDKHKLYLGASDESKRRLSEGFINLAAPSSYQARTDTGNASAQPSGERRRKA